ncbi:MAG TPA: ABC transporter permease, partial [Mucilaginibacter sp.]
MRSYNLHITLYDAAFFGMLFIDLTLILLLWFTQRANRVANRFLAMTLAVVAFCIARLLAIDIGLAFYNPIWSRLAFQFLLALGPLVYFYVLKTTRPEYKFRRIDLLHFSPLVLELAVQVLAIKESILHGITMYDTFIFHLLNPVVQFFVFFSVLFYLFKCRKLIKKFYQQLKFTGGDRYRYQLQWLPNLLTVFGLLWLLWIPVTVLDYFYGLGTHAYYPLYLLLALLMTGMAAPTFLRGEIGVQADGVPILKPSLPADLKQKGIWLKNAVKANNYHQDPELTLSSLAEKLGLTPHELSRIINQTFKKSFSDFINEYRVTEMVRKMHDPAYDHLTLLGIAFESGFNSKTTFNRAFKQVTGKNPVDYKNELKKEAPFYNSGRAPRFATVISTHETADKWSHGKLNRNFMFKNHLKIAWRNIIRGRGYSALNIFGLATGMAVALIIGLWVFNQYSYDKFLPGYTQLYQVERHFYGNGDTLTYGGTSLKLADALRNQIPEIASVAETDGGSLHGLMVGNKKLYMQGNQVAGDFLTMFQYPLLEGKANNVLTDPHSIILTESTAKALFGNEDALNKTVRYDNKNDLKVTGILKDIPSNSTLQFNFLVPFSYLEGSNDFVKRARTAGFGWTNFAVYVQLKPGITYPQVAPKVKDLEKSEKDNSMSMTTNVILDPLTNWHLYDNFDRGKPVEGFIEYVRIFSIIGILVLLIACINFFILT